MPSFQMNTGGYTSGTAVPGLGGLSISAGDPASTLVQLLLAERQARKDALGNLSSLIPNIMDGLQAQKGSDLVTFVDDMVYTGNGPTDFETQRNGLRRAAEGLQGGFGTAGSWINLVAGALRFML